MDRSDVITLISETVTADAYGVERITTASNEVYAQVESVTRSEFFEAGRSGLNPEYRFTIFEGDYSGEEVVEYKGSRYSVYRTYIGKNDNLELYVQREGGKNGSN